MCDSRLTEMISHIAPHYLQSRGHRSIMTPINLCFDSINYQFESESHCDSLEPVISSSKRIFRDHNPIFCGDCRVEFEFSRSLSSQLSYQSSQVESSGSSNPILFQFNCTSHRNSKFSACIQSVCCLDSVSD
jgi:hypothetical protein